MKPDFVVDVGNSRIKWGRCGAACVEEVAALPPDDVAAWQEQRARWASSGPLLWAVSGVHPARRDRLADWLRQQGETVLLLDRAAQLPLKVRLEQPDKIGIDRLFNAVAANTRRRTQVPAVIVDAGSAVTVDFLDRRGAFCGGAILPGLRLMTQSLHDYTALLPLVEIREPGPDMGTSTTTAIHAGVFGSVLGGITHLLLRNNAIGRGETDTFFTGGDAPLLAPCMPYAVQLWPEMTLEGIRLAAVALPEQPTG